VPPVRRAARAQEAQRPVAAVAQRRQVVAARRAARAQEARQPEEPEPEPERAEVQARQVVAAVGLASPVAAPVQAARAAPVRPVAVAR